MDDRASLLGNIDGHGGAPEGGDGVIRIPRSGRRKGSYSMLEGEGDAGLTRRPSFGIPQISINHCAQVAQAASGGGEAVYEAISDEESPKPLRHPEVPLSALQPSIIAHNFSGKYVSDALEYDTVLDLLPDTPMPAVRSVDGRQAISHHTLRSFYANELDLARFGVQPNDRVGVILPNGPEAGVCLMGVAIYATCAPVNSNLQAEEIKFELRNLRCKAVIVPDSRGPEALSPAVMDMLESLDIVVITLRADLLHAGLFTLHGPELNVPQRPTRVPNGPHDIALVLHTSGTSGTKKIVPYPLHNIMVGACCVLASWALHQSDCNLNMMPLFHIGGIARNLFAPILSGGSTVLCKGFDAALFLDVLESTGATWYYAAPTMHQLILQEYKARGRPQYNHKIRMIANAAGGLLPALAKELRETFNEATVLPSYGMTECMPISSPPMDYKLDRPGTSGTAVGPELAIFDDQGVELPRGKVGNICVRGPPLMPGYENNDKANREAFFSNGFFNTGDMGFLDHQGYLFVTGRSKEVINRGGEIISPFDVEEAVITHPRVKDCLAFSAPHDVLQETVGMVIVPAAGVPRPDVKELQRHVAKTLHPSKWPMLIVYMDQTPKNMTNKALRINLGTRFNLPDLSDSVPLRHRLYEATAPPRSASLQSPIPCTKIQLDFDSSASVLRGLKGVRDLYLATAGDLAGDEGSLTAFMAPDSLDADALLKQASEALDDYLVPDKISAVPRIPYTDGGLVDDALLAQMKKASVNVRPPRDVLERQVHDMFQKVLSTKEPISIDASFFELGGDSMKAGTISSMLRKDFRISLPITTLYTHSSIEQLAEAIKMAQAAALASPVATGNGQSPRSRLVDRAVDDDKPVKNCSSTSLNVLLVHMIPPLVLYPAARMAFFFIFVKMIVALHWQLESPETATRLSLYSSVVFTLAKALAVAITFHLTALPLVGILLKWVIVGRYKAGRYPLWGQYYMRWWLAKQTLAITGRGFFALHPSLLCWYYRLLGASIGSNVKIHPKARISEYDLVHIGDSSVLDQCTIRPMAFDKGNLSLKTVIIHNHVSVCCHTIVASGTTLHSAASLGPNSSSYEVGEGDQAYREYNRQDFPGPSLWMQLLLGYPVLAIARLIGLIPRLTMLFVLTYCYPMFLAESGHSFEAFLLWFSSTTRLWYYCTVKIVRFIITPIVSFLCVVLVKAIVIRRFKEGPRTNWSNFQLWLMKTLLSTGTFGKVASIVGTHYEIISVIYRMLGAKIGKRIYWPGSGLDFVEFDLLDIGDDVIFGSRSTLLAGDARESKRIKIEAGAMVADRCVLLPGVTVKRHAVLGSGGIAPKNFTFPPASTYIGSTDGSATLWSTGDAKSAETAPTATPFGRAFYEHKAPFYVMRLWQHVLLNLTVKAFTAVYWALPVLASFRLALIIDHHCPYLPKHPLRTWWAYPIMAVSFSATNTVASILTLLLSIMFKWLVIGRRRPGTYRWDESSYCQRWQILIALDGIRRTGSGRERILQFFHGTAFLVWYYRALGATIGKDVCLYPNGGNPMMTEPDLVTLGDHVCVDDASLIAHINTKGDFKLNRLNVESGSILRTGSRLLSGAGMDKCSTLLEHTLIVAGEVTDPQTVWQGWPAKLIKRTRHTWGQDTSNKLKRIVIEQSPLLGANATGCLKGSCNSDYGATAPPYTEHAVQV